REVHLRDGAGRGPGLPRRARPAPGERRGRRGVPRALLRRRGARPARARVLPRRARARGASSGPPGTLVASTAMRLLLKNLLFTLIVPGVVAVYAPLLIARGRLPVAGPTRAIALLLLATGGAIYSRCIWDFASFGRGTPAPIDAPKR